MKSTRAAFIPLLVLSLALSVVPVRAEADSELGAGHESGAHSPGSASGNTARASAADGGSPVSFDTTASLGPSSAVPWNPPGPVSGAAGWETALRLPGRIVSLPLSGLGALTRRQMLHAENRAFVPRAGNFAGATAQLGIAGAQANLGEVSGLGGGIRFAPPLFHRLLAAEFAASLKGYNGTRLSARFGPLGLGYTYVWRPRERFYGTGPGSSQDSFSTFAAQSEEMRLTADWPSPRAGETGPRTQARAWIGPRRMVLRQGRDAPSFEVLFPELESQQLDAPSEHLVYGGRLTADLRRGRPHWNRGARIAVQAERFDRPLAVLALHDAQSPPVMWTRYTVEVEAGVSFMRDPRTLRLTLVSVDNRPSGSGDLLLEDLAELGGARGLSGFGAGRFHDRGSLAGRLSYIFPLAQFFEFDIHAEAGQVAPDIWRDARLGTLKSSYGLALRPHTRSRGLGAVGLDWSTEAVRLRYSIGGVE